MSDLRSFALAAATRYSGTWTSTTGARLPAVKLWGAWNEANNPVFLTPQYKRVRGKWVIQSAIDYAKICEAVYAGVHAARVNGDKVACGLTAPRGNNNPNEARASVAAADVPEGRPRRRTQALRRLGAPPVLRQPVRDAVDASRTRRPRSRSATSRLLIAQVTTLLREQADLDHRVRLADEPAGQVLRRLLVEAVELSHAGVRDRPRRIPRIQLMLWFLLKDEPNLAGWQSGLETTTGQKKPAFSAFQHLPH